MPLSPSFCCPACKSSVLVLLPLPPPLPLLPRRSASCARPVCSAAALICWNEASRLSQSISSLSDTEDCLSLLPMACRGGAGDSKSALRK